MNRKTARKEKLGIEHELIALGVRVNKLEISYNKVRQEMSGLEGTDPKRIELNKKADRLYLQWEKIKQQFTGRIKRHGDLTANGAYNFMNVTLPNKVGLQTT